MKRRDFLVGTASMIGMALPSLARSQSAPCPPPLMQASDGGKTETACQIGAWVPAPGNIATVGLNSLDSQAPTLGGVKTQPYNIMNAWGGLVYASTYGPSGSLVIYGGGHADYPYNEVYRYEVASRVWSRISDPVYPTYSNNGALVDSEYGEYWSDATFTSLHIGQVSADHTYGHLLWLPAGSIGSDPAGYFFTPGVSSAVNNSGGRAWPHYMPLSSPVWQRGRAKLNAGPGYGVALYDSARNRVAVLSSGSATIGYVFDCASQTAGTFAISSPGVRSYYGTAGYDSAADIYMCATVGEYGSGASLQLIDPVTGAFKLATISGDITAGLGTGGWDWVQSWGAWVYYPGSGQVVYKLKKPGDPWNGAWEMTSQIMFGETALSKSANPHYSRFRYVDNIKCFLWASSTANPVQAFNVTQP